MPSFSEFFSTLWRARSEVRKQAEPPRQRGRGADPYPPGVLVPDPDGRFQSKIVMMPVTSSNLSAIGYDYLRNVLQISFKAKKTRAEAVYQYESVPVEIWNGLKAASSKGKYVWDHIRGRTLPGPFRYRMVSYAGYLTDRTQYMSERPIARAPGGYGPNMVNDPQNNPALVAKEAKRDPYLSHNPQAAYGTNAARQATVGNAKGGFVKGFKSFLRGAAS